MKAEYINPFINATKKVLGQMAFVESQAGKPTIRNNTIPTGRVISAVIDLSGGTRGSIGISFTRKCILAIATNMFGETYEEINSDILDMIGEIVNMISGEARRELAENGFQFKAGIPKTFTGDDHSIQHEVSGPTILIPFETPHGEFSLEACFETEQFFDKVSQSQHTVDIKEKNNSLIQTRFGCFIHDPPQEIPVNLLKKDSQMTRSNIFLIPEYIRPLPGFDSCNFLKLEVIVCPKCFFASNRLNFFKHGQQTKHQNLQDEEIRKTILPFLMKMKMIGDFAPVFYTHNRTIEQAITAFELAMYSSNALFSKAPQLFPEEPVKIGEYALKAAMLSKLQLNEEREAKHLRTAFSILRRQHKDLKGAKYYRILYLLLALSVYMEETAHAKNYFGTMLKKFPEDKNFVSSEERSQAKQYMTIAKKVWDMKEDLTFSKNTDKKSYIFW